MLNVGGLELLIILLVALIFLGPERLPGVARQIGQTVSGLRSLASGFQAELEAAAKPDAAAPAAADSNATDASMTLAGPTSRAEAVAATQTDPAMIADAARQVVYDDDDAENSADGPVDLRGEEE